MNNTILTILTVSFYSLAIIIQAHQIVKKFVQQSWVYFILGFLAVISHAVLLYHWIDTLHGQNISFVNLFSLVAWLVAFLVLLAALIKPIANLTLFIFPIALSSIFLEWYFPAILLANTQSHPKELIHILLSTMAFSLLCICGLQAFFLAIQEYLLRHKRPARFIQLLPPLQQMEKFLFQMITTGFIFLTILLVTSFWSFGYAVITNFWQKTLLSLFGWTIFASLLAGHRYAGWRSWLVIRYTLGGVFLVMLVYFGSEFL
jgi:ABC-type uncharacterized transport system permease subunit